MEHTEHLEHTEPPHNMKAQIWRTFWILFALTLVDIALYFMLLSTHSLMKNFLFVLLGVVKAYYIVAVFMHMKFERNWLSRLIIYPMVLVIYLVALMLIEGEFTALLR
ncbi:MAG: cytochrome C oxidase subunit IV family protein [Bacteroidia bacterium]|jgi:cytochrome c oxidase subunit IV